MDPKLGQKFTELYVKNLRKEIPHDFLSPRFTQRSVEPTRSTDENFKFFINNDKLLLDVIF